MICSKKQADFKSQASFIIPEATGSLRTMHDNLMNSFLVLRQKPILIQPIPKCLKTNLLLDFEEICTHINF